MLHRLPKWLLAVILVLGHASLLAHQSDLDAHSELADDCVVCHIASGMGDCAVDTSTHAIIADAGHVPTAVISVTAYSSFPNLPRSRSPPLIHVSLFLN
jgi:hypothetical protein